MKKIAIIAACLALGVAANASETTPSRAKARASAMAHPMYFRIDAGTDVKTKTTGHYKKAHTETAYTSTKNKSGIVGQIGLGYRFNEMIRGDITLVHRMKNTFKGTGATTTDHQKFTHSAVMLNGYVDVMTFNNVTPYLHAGVGYGQLTPKKMKTTTNSSGAETAQLNGRKTRGVTWSAGAGVALALNPTMSVDLGYKFVNLGKIKTKANADNTTPAKSGKASVHELLLGLRYNF